MYREYRNAACMTIKSASEESSIALRTLVKYESGDITPDVEKVFKISQIYDDPEITHWYCWDVYPVG